MDDQKTLWDLKWGSIIEICKPSIYSKFFYDFVKIRNPKTVLDLGSGDGRDSLYFLEKGLFVTAVDFSDVSLVRLRKNYNSTNLKTISIDLRKLDFMENSFDLIYANSSLHYFTDFETKQIFNNLYKFLKPNGVLFVRCKSLTDSLYSIGREIEDNVFENKQIRHFFSENYMADCLMRFNILKIKSVTSDHLLLTGENRKSSFIEVIAEKK
jgi:tellurite methyltransferase